MGVHIENINKEEANASMDIRQIIHILKFVQYSKRFLHPVRIDDDHYWMEQMRTLHDYCLYNGLYRQTVGIPSMSILINNLLAPGIWLNRLKKSNRNYAMFHRINKLRRLEQLVDQTDSLFNVLGKAHAVVPLTISTNHVCSKHRPMQK